MAGFLQEHFLDIIFDEIKNVDGAIAEIGVNEGSLFHRLIKRAKQQNKVCCAFDSFRGMGKPDIYLDDFNNYPAGKFDIGGVESFYKIMWERYAIAKSEYLAFDGFIPLCFPKCNINKFAFIYIDVDHNKPTELSIKWAIDRIEKGGIIGFDDYFKGNKKGCSVVIDDFRKLNKDRYEIILNNNNQIFFKRL